MAEFTPTGLRVFLTVAETGSFTMAAAQLGYSQSAVSRQIAGLEQAAGQPLFVRHRAGVRLTASGGRLLGRARVIVDELDAALADMRPVPTTRVRLGAFPAAVASFVPDALVRLRHEHPDLSVTVREGATPSLVRATRTGSIDLAVIAQAPPYRPFDTETPTLDVTALSERDLLVAVGPGHLFVGRHTVDVSDLGGQTWVASPSGGDALLGVWPGLVERPDARFVVRDWMAKLRLVATGAAITTVTASLVPYLPIGVHAIEVVGAPTETRRLSIVRLPGEPSPHVATVMRVLGSVTRAGAAPAPSSLR